MAKSDTEEQIVKLENRNRALEQRILRLKMRLGEANNGRSALFFAAIEIENDAQWIPEVFWEELQDAIELNGGKRK